MQLQPVAEGNPITTGDFHCGIIFHSSVNLNLKNTSPFGVY